ncbi:MAG: hypothetical protein ACR2HP_05035 [Ilumatobacteraceae bacterium]
MPSQEATRITLQQLAVHVLARRRFAVTGRFGLRPSPGGLATPAFGDEIEVGRMGGDLFVHERGGEARVEPISTLAAAAELVGADLSADFSVGGDTPALGPVDDPLGIDGGQVRALGAWWAFGVEVIDHVVGTGPWRAGATTLQLWPEHFDVGGAVTVGGTSVNVGASPGDGHEPAPYLYIGPTTADRPGDAAYWNAPFGAVLRWSELSGPADRQVIAADFLRQGLQQFT